MPIPTLPPIPGVPRQRSVPEVIAALAGAAAPLLLDVRLPEDRDALPIRLPGAIERTHAEVAALVPPSGRPLVCVCHKGLKLSIGAAALLRDAGHEAEVLAGGAVAWADAGAPVIDADALPASGLWVCDDEEAAEVVRPLLRRALPDHRLMLVPPDARDAVADKFGARHAPPTAAALCSLLGLPSAWGQS